MRIKVDGIRKPMQITLKGDEPWLDFIYKSFGQAGKSDAPRLTGTLTLAPADYGAYYLTGEIDFTPQVSCGRCAILIPWPIHRKLDARFLTPYQDADNEPEKDLTPEDLDDYYIENKEIDIEPVINDLIQTALPSRLVQASEDGKSCAVCHDDLATPRHYEQGGGVESHPFAALKNLKLPE